MTADTLLIVAGIALFVLGAYFWYAAPSYDDEKTKAKASFILGSVFCVIWLIIQVAQKASIIFWASIILGGLLLILLFIIIRWLYSDLEKLGCPVVIGITFLFLVTAFCGWSTRPQLISWPQKIHFTGYVLDPNNLSGVGKYPNDRLVVLYYNGSEIGRTNTKAGKTTVSEMRDGFFEISLDNTYQLSEDSIKGAQRIDDTFSSYLEVFSPLISEGKSISFFIPEKAIEYKIKVFSGKINALPPNIQTGNSTEWVENRLMDIKTVQQAALKFTDSISTLNVAVQITGQDETPGEFFELAGTPNNCSSSIPYSLKTTMTKEIIHEFDANTTFNILAPLEARLGYKNGNIETLESEIAVQIPAHTNAIIGITPIYIWDKGNIQIAGQIIEFRARKGIRYEISQKELPCK